MDFREALLLIGALRGNLYGSFAILANPIGIFGDGKEFLNIVLSPKAGQIEGTVKDWDKKATATTEVILIPEKFRDRVSFYGHALVDTYGHFNIGSISPGDYKLFAWEDLPPGAYFDPDFIKEFEDKGQGVHVEESSSITRMSTGCRIKSSEGAPARLAALPLLCLLSPNRGRSFEVPVIFELYGDAHSPLGCAVANRYVYFEDVLAQCLCRTRWNERTNHVLLGNKVRHSRQIGQVDLAQVFKARQVS